MILLVEDNPVSHTRLSYSLTQLTLILDKSKTGPKDAYIPRLQSSACGKWPRRHQPDLGTRCDYRCHSHRSVHAIEGRHRGNERDPREVGSRNDFSTNADYCRHYSRQFAGSSAVQGCGCRFGEVGTYTLCSSASYCALEAFSIHDRVNCCRAGGRSTSSSPKSALRTLCMQSESTSLHRHVLMSSGGNDTQCACRSVSAYYEC